MMAIATYCGLDLCCWRDKILSNLKSKAEAPVSLQDSPAPKDASNAKEPAPETGGTSL